MTIEKAEIYKLTDAERKQQTITPPRTLGSCPHRSPRPIYRQKTETNARDRSPRQAPLRLGHRASARAVCARVCARAVYTTRGAARRERMPAQAFGAQLRLSYVLAAWSVAVYAAILLYSLLFDNQFVRFGPNASLHFLYMDVDAWGKWAALVLFIVATQVLKVLADEIISPWIMNTVMDHKGEGPEMRYRDVQAVCQTYYFFSATVQFVSISVTVAQLDLVLVLIATDLLVSAYTTHVFIRAKSPSLPTRAPREPCAADADAPAALCLSPRVVAEAEACPPRPPRVSEACPPRPPRVRGPPARCSKQGPSDTGARGDRADCFMV